MSRKQDIADLQREVDNLRRDLDAIVRARALEKHQHNWQYSKTTGGHGDSFGGAWTLWSWKCPDDICKESGGSNHRGGIPDHFPVDLR